MEIRLLDKEEYELSKKLWLECFPEDDAGFVDWYYSERSRPEQVLGAFSAGEGEPAAMLHMIPMRMRFLNEVKRVCFVAGVCTRPALRGRGLCSALFERAFEIMRVMDFDATALQPFDPAFYERFGYETYLTRNTVTLPYARTNMLVRSYDAVPDPEKLLELYSDYTSRYDGCSIRDEEYFRSFIKEYSMPGARLIATGEGCCAGYYEADGARFTAAELFFREGADVISLLPGDAEACSFPLPLDLPVPMGCTAKAEGACMIRPLKTGFSFDPSRCFGFDRY